MKDEYDFTYAKQGKLYRPSRGIGYSNDAKTVLEVFDVAKRFLPSATALLLTLKEKS